ncbi:4Fe-4S dicluster domain-containing protein [Clostridium sp. JN-9]|uniref:4Fe-4S dicluster domain-containing protein n=1 Tax=Clostridium sp. JN-9 TaxID=2507159 RepID=UPI000FFE0FF8|nr:4Fe-4S dicluster domain-containing protein [Clostridium sp. JN-9]QAT40377.1 proton-conducting membrane transporter [Clostridium sp. JN-9]
MDLLEQIYNAGVVGAGGAGFPTHKKLNCKVQYFIINAAECEPLLQTDKYIMRNFSHEIIKAAEAVSAQVGADKAVIALKRKYIDEIEALNKAIKDLNSKVKLHYLKSIYPAGDEHVLVNDVTKKVIPPGGIPLNVGAVVNNVGTVLNIYEAMNGLPVTEKYVSVLGEVNSPKIVKVPIGTSVLECIKAAGGASIKDFVIIMGGPMMGRLISGDDIGKRTITKTDGGIIVLPEDHYLVTQRQVPIEHLINRAKSACIQCSACTEMCPRHLLGHPLRPHKIMRAISTTDDYGENFKEALICSECGICEMYACPMGLSPRRINVFLKGELRKKGIKYSAESKEYNTRDYMDYKQIDVSRLVGRLNVSRYTMKNINEAEEYIPAEVSIPLKQHIGMTANAVVNAGDTVTKGQLIASVKYEDMGANIHASIDGTVISVGENIVIKS